MKKEKAIDMPGPVMIHEAQSPRLHFPLFHPANAAPAASR
eukprot:CAMPEP_0180145498 /NCGR_PEP_ID=MMETSP0986-20121125/17723_1 /TAXON_ID=697907 /ORGANISM="non described non described, Strain CCMP2293" /LENGTH=39 /DNA_ID= /DNA_START= /DNA_END= /DNA_ORIENTATION=